MGNESQEHDFTFNGCEHDLDGLEDLRCHLERIRHDDFAEASLRRGPEWTYLLTNGEQGRAFLMFLSDEDPAGYRAVSPSRSGPGEEAVAFLLSNGQRDEYTVQDTVPLSEGLSAFVHFYTHGGRASSVLWRGGSQGAA